MKNLLVKIKEIYCTCKEGIICILFGLILLVVALFFLTGDGAIALRRLLKMIGFIFLAIGAGGYAREALEKNENSPTKEKSTKNKMRIRRKHFDFIPDQDHKTQPNDDIHSIILESVEKRWWKLPVYCIDGYPPFHMLRITAQVGLLASIASLGRCSFHNFMWVFPACCAIFFSSYLTWTWFARKLRLRNKVRNRKYLCEIDFKKENLYLIDGILELEKKEYSEEYVRFEIYIPYELYAPLDLKIEKQI